MTSIPVHRNRPLTLRARQSRWSQRGSLLGCALACVWPQVAFAGPPEGKEPASKEIVHRDAVVPAAGVGQRRRFAIVIGTNVAKDRNQAALRYADDDAARIATLLAETGFEVELLTTFDAESQQLFPSWVSQAHRPSPRELDAAAARIQAEVVRAQSQGQATDLLVYYSGHGDVGPDGQGFFNLEGGELTRKHLFGKLLGDSAADRKHLLVDACRSEELVLSRGNERDKYKSDRVAPRDPSTMRSYMDKTLLGGHPDTGVLLAVSADQQTHEWERYRGGVFTHQLLSALRGGADVNGDGSLEYSEVGAFVAAANSGVADPRAKLSVVVRPPVSDERAPVLVHEDVAAQRVVLFGGADDHHYVLEDARGIRLADLRRDGSRPGYLRLPDNGPVFIFRERPGQASADEATIPADRIGVVSAETLDFVPAQRRSRGAIDEAFRDGLFSVPYGLGYYAAFRDREGLVGVADPDWEVRVWKREDGEMVEVTRVSGTDPKPETAAPEGPKKRDDHCDEDEDDCDDVFVEIEHGRRRRRPLRAAWGSFQIGTEFTPFDPGAEIRLAPKRVIANEFAGFGSKPGLANLRGVDARWTFFKARGPWYFPAAEGYFRTGYTRGFADFLPEDDVVGFLPDDATRLDYFTVPLFLGGNLFAPFRRFPVRPYAGAGFGFDVLALDYNRAGRPNRQDVSARIGFELHAGLDIRISNFVSIVGELRQLWSARRKLASVPDFSNEGLTIITAIRVGIPLHPQGWKQAREQPRPPKRTRRVEQDESRDDKGRSDRDIKADQPRVDGQPVPPAPERGESSVPNGSTAPNRPERPETPEAPERGDSGESGRAVSPAPAPSPGPTPVTDPWAEGDAGAIRPRSP